MTTQPRHLGDDVVEVQAPIEHAFRVFTEGIGTWWNPDHHILQADLAPMFGRHRRHIIDRGTDGRDAAGAGRSPTNRRAVVQLGHQPAAGAEPDPAKASEIEVTFTATVPTAPTWSSPTGPSTGTATAGRARARVGCGW